MKKIAVIDSGVGGVALLNRLKNNLIAHYYYIADSENMPYGSRSEGELRAIAEKLFIQAQQLAVDMVIIACNTLTLASINYLRARHPDTLIYGCQPPIKQALQYTASSSLLLATPYVIDHVERQCSLLPVAMTDLATMVEERASNRAISQYIEQNVANSVGETPFDSVILGCTHYSHVRQIVSSIYPNCKIFDSCDSLASYVRRQNKNKRNCELESQVEIVINSCDEGRKIHYSKNIELILKSY